MPLYVYKCGECHEKHEALQGINDKPLITCPNCGDDALKKEITAAAFTFKGSGWYKDLYSSSKPEKKSDSKPASKPTTTPDKKATQKKETAPKAKAS